MTFTPPTTIVSRASGNQSVSNNTWVRVTWDTVVVDDESMANLGSDATKLIMPAGYTKVRFTVYVVWDNAAGGNRLISIEKNDGGTQGAGAGIACLIAPGENESGHSLTTPWITGLVAGTDYFNVWVLQSSGGAIGLHGDSEAGFGGPSSWMAELAA